MTRKLNVGSHDLPVSPRLSEFMKGGWAETERTGLPPHAAALWTPARRAQISAQYPASG
jgi:Xaa-Pro aminopeptidase